MNQRSCKNCGGLLNEEVRFCPHCGKKCQTYCSSCGEVLDPDAKFCKHCGNSRSNVKENEPAASTQAQPTQQTPLQPSVIERLRTWYETTKYAKVILLSVLAIALGVGVSFYYFSSMSEDRYLTRCGEATQRIANANSTLVKVFAPTPPGQSATPLSQTQQSLQVHKNELDELAGTFQSMHPPSKFEDQHQKLLELLRLEQSIVQEALLILPNPLAAETDNLLNSNKEQNEAARNLGDSLAIPGISFRMSNEMTTFPNEITLYVEGQRKALREKQELLTSLTKFFQEMDGLIQRYDNAKTDLGGMLENLRKGGYTWGDYFSSLSQARNIRSSLRFQADRLSAPKGAEELKRQFSDVLTNSLRYCDMMNAAARVEHGTNYNYAVPKYKEASGVNDQVQESYSSFRSFYQSEKERLSHIENL